MTLESLRKWPVLPGARGVALGVALLLVVLASLSGFIVSRQHSEVQPATFGAVDNPDRVDITAWVTRVDVAAQRIEVVVADVRPIGSLADERGQFAADAMLDTNGLQNAPIKVRAGELIPNAGQNFSLSGVVADFPFDHYTSYVSFRLQDSDGTEIPIAVTVESTDAFFTLTPTLDGGQFGWLDTEISVKRTTPTIAFGIFVMMLMLGLAVAAALLAFFVIRSRQGLVLGAYSVMAGLLFAMVPLRNAVPGNPPIGSAIDFLAFFIAEAVISVSLIASVVVGHRYQKEIDGSVAEAGEGRARGERAELQHRQQ